MSKMWVRRLLAVATFATPIALVGTPFGGRGQTVYLPGPTSGGHHQIEEKCATCHVALSGASDDACLGCHGQDLRDSDDSHAVSKFDDPGRVAQLALVDARSCIPCHREHRTEARAQGSVTMAPGLCIGCHADIGQERPNHRGFAADTCASTGCHNYHDNRALYRDFLIKHRDEPALLAEPRVPAAIASDQPFTRAIPDAPLRIAGRATYAAAVLAWSASAHARGNVNCTDCHSEKNAARESRWRDEAPDAMCAGCHAPERAGWMAGKHGMRAGVALTAMSPARARLPMKANAPAGGMGCTSCHGAHLFDRGSAAVEGCQRCHDDRHTRAYRGSAHERTWLREQRGETPAGSGVSCATCHLPRQRAGDRIMVQHNQNANLRPRDRMVRTVCMSCHGVGFSLAALADAALVQANFQGRPTPAIKTGMDLIAEGATHAK